MPQRVLRKVKRMHAVFPAFFSAYALYSWANWKADQNERKKWY